MLGALFAAAVYDAANRHCRVGLPTEHMRPLCSLVNDRVHAIKHEVDSWMNDDRAITAQRSSDRCTSACELRTGVSITRSQPKLLVKVGHRVTDVPRAPEALSYNENIRVPPEKILEGVTDRIP